MAKPLEKREEELAALLARAGLTPAQARVHAALARGGHHAAADLASVTGLARQDAGDAANELVRLGLARVERAPSGPAGGRPTNRYHREEKGLAAFVEARRKALTEELHALDALL